MIIIAAAVILPFIAVTGSASASVTPNTTPATCKTTTTPWACVQVFGNGTDIVQMNGWAHNTTGAQLDYLHIELYDTYGVVIKNCGQFNLAAGANSPNCSWAPNAGEPAANYCAAVWQWLGGKNYADLGWECVLVS